MKSRRSVPISAAAVVLLMSGGALLGQPEVMGWGNLTGIRVDGHLLEFGTSLCVLQPDGAGLTRTAKERQTNMYVRAGSIETIKYTLRPSREFREQGADWSLTATKAVEDSGPGSAKIDVEFTSPKAANIGGAFLGLELPSIVFSGGTVQLIEPVAPAPKEASLAPGEKDQNEYLRAVASGARFISPKRQLEVMFDGPTEIIIRDDRRQGNYEIQVLLTVLPGQAAEGQSAKKSFALKASGEIDKTPVTLALNASRPGQAFDGLGGNFRLQNPKTDPPVIDYSLENLRVS